METADISWLVTLAILALIAGAIPVLKRWR